MTLHVPTKKLKLDEERSPILKTEGKHINDLPAENLGQILRSGLSVIDRLHCARVSRHWKWAVGEFGWTEQRKIDRNTVFEGISPEEVDQYSLRFWQISTPGDCHFVSLLKQIASGPFNNLMELDLHSFGSVYVQAFILRIAETLQMFPKLEKLNIEDFDLADFVEFLPPILRSLHLLNSFSIQTLEILAVRCPNMEEVPFSQVDNITLDIVNDYLPRFPRQTTLIFDDRFEGDTGNLTAIAELKQLEVLEIFNVEGFDAEALEAMTKKCKKLRKFSYLNTIRLTEKSLFKLARMPNLTVLELWDRSGVVTDSVLKSVAKRGKLKRAAFSSQELTDDSVLFLRDRCKSLVSLELYDCSNITDRSLGAVVSEVHRRHGQPPRSFPSGPEDDAIFFFVCHGTKINKGKALELAAGNPWLMLEFGSGVEPREII